MLIIIALIILTEDFPMLVNYEILTVRLNRYLSEQYPDVTTHTDIFEHAFLRFLGYQSVPEKCLFKDNQPNHSLSIYLKAPYNIANSEFIDALRICATGGFSAIRIEEINPNSDQGFCVRLSIPYPLIDAHLSGIFQSIDKILADPLKMNFYCYWNIHAIKFRFALTMMRIEELAREKLLHYPQMTLDEVWSAIIQKETRKDFNVKFLEKKVSVDVNNFPKITLIYEENGEKNEIAMTRDQIVTTLAGETLDKFFIHDITLQEFITPAEISQFIEKKYHRFFSINTECHYEIDLGYHYAERKILEKYDIKELSRPYRPNGDAPERTQIYVYDKDNYQKLLLALKEIKGEKCFNERWHQLTYYIHHQMWEKLYKELKFLLNLKVKMGVEIDYTELLIRLYYHARDNLQKEAQKNTIATIEKVCKSLVSTMPLKSEMQKEIDKLLFELTLLRMNQLKTSDETKRLGLKKELFIYTQRIGLEESNHYLAEIAGLGFGNTFSENVNENPIAVLLEIAEKYKVAIEENARLKSEGDKPSSQEAIASSNINKVSYFSRK